MSPNFHNTSDPYGIISAMPVLAVWLMMAASGYVLFEPAPFDVLFLALFPLFMVFGLRVPKRALLLLILAFGFIAFSVVGSNRGPRYDESLRHVFVTGLLCAVSVFITCFVTQFRERGLRAIMNGWVVAGVITSLLGIAGYFGVLGGMSEDFVLYGRAKGAFKDPNVFAPFLVVPAIYCIYQMITRSHMSALFYGGVLGVLLLGLLLSFSRGGWLNLFLSALIAVVLWVASNKDPVFRARLVFIMIVGVVASALALVWLLSFESVGDLFANRAQLTQNYDSAANGRFAGQLVTIEKILANPLGLGARGFLPDWFEQPHNVYLFLFMVGGWPGGLFYIAMLVLTLAYGFKALSRPSPSHGISIIFISCFIGLVMEGVVVDTDHWRHFFVVMGAVWGIGAMAERPEPNLEHAQAVPRQALLRGTVD